MVRGVSIRADLALRSAVTNAAESLVQSLVRRSFLVDISVHRTAEILARVPKIVHSVKTRVSF